MSKKNSYIDVAVALPVHGTFTYRVPAALQSNVTPGKRILMPFGHRRVTGFITGYGHTSKVTDIKDILDVLDEKPLFPKTMLSFFRWIADYYFHPLGEVIKNALPGGLTIYDHVTLTITTRGRQALVRKQTAAADKKVLEALEQKSCTLKKLSRTIQPFSPSLIRSLERRNWLICQQTLKVTRTTPKTERWVAVNDKWQNVANKLPKLSKARRDILTYLTDVKEISVKNLKSKFPTAPRLINLLAADGLVTIYSKRLYRDPLGESVAFDRVPELTEEQHQALTIILKDLEHGFKAHLLHGVTGSGKTEIYLQLAHRIIRSGVPVIVLVPEIALITQMERRFRARFGERVAVLHSGLSTGERLDQWMRIADGAVDIAIGARSAVFAPFAKIGLMIVDEEHDPSYKQESGLRYNARDLALVRAKLDGATVVLGSATPSIQSYYNAATGKLMRLTLNRRVHQKPLPAIKIVDLRRMRDLRGTDRFITPELRHAIQATLQRKEQTILFLNRRGFAGFPVCGACGKPIRCKNCDITLTLHRNSNAFKCHYCGFSKAASSACPACGSDHIHHLGLGTEKLEAAIHRLFPEANVARMDRDTTTRRGSILKILRQLKNGAIDILIGTQMVAKGHDFPNITLVGIICADLSLSFPDFRAGERTFQLLAQVAGRAGRGKRLGRVILQTYNPAHFSITTARQQDYPAFYKQEIAFRQTLNYPPFARMVLLRITGQDARHIASQAQSVGELCRQIINRRKRLQSITILGPIEAPLARIARRYRWHLLLKSPHTGPLHKFVHELVHRHSNLLNTPHVRTTIDVDPYFMM